MDARGGTRTGREQGMLDLFGGDQPVVTTAAARFGCSVVTLDSCVDPVGGDLTNQSVVERWGGECEAARVWAVKSDLPCSSFTCLWGKPARPGAPPKPKLRSRALLPGLPPTPPEWRLYMRKHERWVGLTFDWATPVVLAGGRAAVEGPTDRGNPLLGWAYRQAYADHAPLELHPRALAFCKATGGRVVHSFQCACGGAFQKATSHIADAATADALGPLAALPCVHVVGGHEGVADGVDGNGESLSNQSRVYPSSYAEAVAVGLAGGTAEDVLAIVAPAFQEVVRVAAAAGTLRDDLPAWVVNLAVGVIRPEGEEVREITPRKVAFNPVIDVIRT